MPVSSTSGLGAELRFGGATASLPAMPGSRLWMGLRWVPGMCWGVGQRWDEEARGVCTAGTTMEGDSGGGPALCLWTSSGSRRGLGEGTHTAEHCPLCPQHSPRPYHTSQCLPGFMGDPRGQPKCSTKSRELLRVPMTRYLSGLWGSVTSPSWELSGVRMEHHTCAKPTKKSWWLVSSRAGRRFSSPFFCSQDLYACRRDALKPQRRTDR